MLGFGSGYQQTAIPAERPKFSTGLSQPDRRNKFPDLFRIVDFGLRLRIRG